MKQVEKVRHYTKKASCGGLFCICLFGLLNPVLLQAGCATWQQGEPQVVSKVLDGDTLVLANGRKVRLIGINTPEMGRDNQPAESFALQAKTRLVSLLKSSDSKLFIRPGIEPMDRYRRQLAHVYDQKGESLAEKLLSEGLGYVIVIPPNLRHLDCLREAEQQARKAQIGVWSQKPAVNAARLAKKASGFHLVHGKIQRIGKSRRSLWLNLQGGVALRIDWVDQRAYFPQADVEQWVGRSLEVRGWIYHHKGEKRLQVRHPAAMKWLD